MTAASAPSGLGRTAVLAASAGLDGWLTPDEAEVLFDLAAAGPGSGAIVEIGSFVGKSLVCLAGGAKLHARERVVSIDTHRGSAEHQPGGFAFLPAYWNTRAHRVDTQPALLRNLAATGTIDWVEVLATSSARAVQTWRRPIRLLFLDGEHSTEALTHDLDRWGRWVSDDGIIAAHDYDLAGFPEVVRTLDRWLASHPAFRRLMAVDRMLVVQRRGRRHSLSDRSESVAASDEWSCAWRNATAGQADARAQWRVEEGGVWTWEAEGMRLRSDKSEWAACSWQALGPAEIARLRSFLVRATARGKAQAAGFSLGPYQDFLTELTPLAVQRSLELEVHVDAGLWAFRVDGETRTRDWWDAALRGPTDLARGTLTLKARNVTEVLFSDLRVQPVVQRCNLSVIITCHRFLQRLRVTLRNWCHQTLPTGAYEVLVVTAGNPDGVSGYLEAVARSFPNIRVREVRAPSSAATRKGELINRVLEECQGEWIWLTDADCLFERSCAQATLAYVGGRRDRLFFGERRHLSTAQTDALISGRVDGLREFDGLLRDGTPRAPDLHPWGYTQIFHRSVLDHVRYEPTIAGFARSDERFVDECRRRGIPTERVPGLTCLHLDHPFAWNGTSAFL